MTSVAMTALLLAARAATLDVAVAPDQTMPHVYMGDPLIIAFEAAEDTQAAINIDIVPDHGAPSTFIQLAPQPFRGGAARWLTIGGAPDLRGRYYLNMIIEAGGEASQTTAQFCRVDRPPPGYVLPLWVHVDGLEPKALLALRGIATSQIQLPADMPDIANAMRRAKSLGFDIAVRLDAASGDAPETDLGGIQEHVARWALDAEGDPAAAAATIQRLRESGVRAPVGLVVRAPGDITQLLAAGLASETGAFVFEHDWPTVSDIVDIRAFAERAGYERVPIVVDMPALAAGEPDAGPRLARQMILHRVAGASSTGLAGSHLVAQAFGPGYVYAGTLAHRLRNAVYIGRLDLPGGHAAFAFRNGSRWILALWNVDAPSDLELAIGEATGLLLFDGRNNPITVPEPSEGRVTLLPSACPLFLEGEGGSVLGQAAQQTVRGAVQALRSQPDLAEGLGGGFIAAIEAFDKPDGQPHTRLEFLNLLRLFPRIEGAWRGGGVTGSVAVPAIAGLARLTRALCTFEQERGEPFVEPLQSTLANCGKFQSQYLTSSSGSAAQRERPDWVLTEVTRLMAQAEALAAEERPIEAGAVAALAEWRARSLEATAEAKPLNVPQPAPPPDQQDDQTEEESES